MIHKITCAINTDDLSVLQKLEARLSLSGISVKNINSPGRYIYIDISWDDADIQKTPIRNHNRAGAKPRKLTYDGGDATCGLVWKLRNESHLSDAEIGLVLGASESTIARRRKKHLANGDFHSGSAAVF